MDARDNPRFLDLVVTPPGGEPVEVTRNGFKNFLAVYRNGTGQTSIVSGVLGAEIQLTDRLRADLGGRVEYNNFVQSTEQQSTFDLDGNPETTFDNESFGNGSFRHLTRDITEWAASVGLNFRMNDNLSFYAAGSRGYKMPELDAFLTVTAQEQADLFEAKEVQTVEGGVKTQIGGMALTLTGFAATVKKNIGQGLESVNGVTTWVTTFQPDTRSYGAEVEAVVNPVEGLLLQGNATVMEAELGGGVAALEDRRGLRLALSPRTLGNVVGIYTLPGEYGLQVKADWHWVAARFSEGADRRNLEDPAILPSYNYFNFGAGFAIPGAGTRVNVDLLNAFQSKGLEEGNPRLASAGGLPVFLARAILPRRLQVSVSYDFGGAAPTRQQ
jgi:outer membrane receptor protein involved in Fe transport